MAKSLIFLLLITGGFSERYITTENVEVIERNLVYGDQGEVRLDQVIFWDGFECRGWICSKYVQSLGETTFVLDKRGLHRIRGAIFVVRSTRHDREIEGRNLVPLELRRCVIE